MSQLHFHWFSYRFPRKDRDTTITYPFTPPLKSSLPSFACEVNLINSSPLHLGLLTASVMEPLWRKTASRVQDYRAQGLRKVQPPLPEIPSNLPKSVTHVPHQLLSQREIVITDSSPEDLLSYLRAGEWSSEEVARAYLRRASLAQELVSTHFVWKTSTDKELKANCITELLPTQAISRAQELDRFIKENQRPMGALHGLPISVKEQIGMKGLTCNAAFVAWADKVMDDDALILKILWKAGCIFYARTTEPQALVRNILGCSTFDQRQSCSASSECAP